MVGAMCHRVLSAQPLKGLKVKVSHRGRQPCVCGGVTIKSLDTEAQVNFSGWQPPCVPSLSIAGGSRCRAQKTPPGENRRELCTWNPPGPCPMRLFPLLILTCIPLL